MAKCVHMYVQMKKGGGGGWGSGVNVNHVSSEQMTYDAKERRRYEVFVHLYTARVKQSFL